VLAALADKAAPVRTAAVWAALRLPGEVARGQVRALLKSDDEPLRFDAASALAEVGDPAALPLLIESLREGHRRQEALSSIMSLGDAAALPALSKLWEPEDEVDTVGDFDRTMLAAALARFGDARGAGYLAERAATDGDDRPVAVEWAGRLGVREAIPALEELSEEEGEPARGAALRALGRLKADGAEQRLLDVALDAEHADDLRMDAAEGLAELGSEKAMAALRDLAAGSGELADLSRDLLGELAQAEAQKAEVEKAGAPRAEAAAPGKTDAD
jgi:HEAT repeat protein